jgi:hypothetical protein
MASEARQGGVVVDQPVAEHPQLHQQDHELVAGACHRTGRECRTPVACRHWGCQDGALAEGLRGVAVAVDLLGLGKQQDG